MADHEGSQRAADEDTLHDVADGVPHHSHAEDRDGACGQQVAVRCTASNCLSNSRLGRPSDGRMILMRWQALDASVMSCHISCQMQEAKLRPRLRCGKYCYSQKDICLSPVWASVLSGRPGGSPYLGPNLSQTTPMKIRAKTVLAVVTTPAGEQKVKNQPAEQKRVSKLLMVLGALRTFQVKHFLL